MGCFVRSCKREVIIKNIRKWRILKEDNRNREPQSVELTIRLQCLRWHAVHNAELGTCITWFAPSVDTIVANWLSKSKLSKT